MIHVNNGLLSVSVESHPFCCSLYDIVVYRGIPPELPELPDIRLSIRWEGGSLI